MNQMERLPMILWQENWIFQGLWFNVGVLPLKKDSFNSRTLKLDELGFRRVNFLISTTSGKTISIASSAKA
jgi:hypothetical protein